MRHNFSYILSVLFVFLYLQFAFSQTSGSKLEVDSLGVQITKPIPVENVIQKISDATDEIKIISRKVELKDKVVKIDSLFPSYSKFLTSQKKSAQKFIKSNPNRQKINNQIKMWNGYNDHLSSWEVTIDEYEERNVNLLAGIEIDERIWELTYQNALEQKVPFELAGNVKKTWGDYQRLHREIRVENNKLLILESRINKQSRLIDEVVEQLTELKSSEVYDLFYLRHEPLWQSDFRATDEQEASKGLSGALKVNVDAFIKYIVNFKKDFFWFLVCIGLIYFFLRWLRLGFDKYEFKEKKKSLLDAKSILQEQFRYSLLFISFLFAWYFFDNQPMIFTDLLILGMLIISIPLIKPHISEPFKSMLYFVVAIYVLDTAKTYIWFSSPQYRLYLLFEAIFVIFILFKFTFKPLKNLKLNDFQFKGVLIMLSPVFQFIALVSVVSNIFGYTNLADLTLKISSQSGVYAIIFYAMSLVAAGLFIGILHRHYYSRETFSYKRKVFVEVRTVRTIRWVVLFLWVLLLLEMVDLIQPIRDYFENTLTDPYKFGNITITLGDILQFVMILVASFVITSLVSFLFESGKVKVGILKLPKGIPAAISLVVRYFIIATGIVFALSSLGVDLSKFNLMAGALGLGIGFGLQNVISNFVSGLILVFERPILVGDTIEVNSLLGTVNRIGVRSSNISTFDGAEVVVPNSNLISNDLINWTLSNSIKRVEILVGVAYGTDPNQVLDILTGVLQDMDEILKDPPPHALFSEFGDSSLNFRLRFWVPFTIGLQAKSDVSIAIYNQFKEHNIEIPFPQRDVNIRSVPEQRKEE